MTFAGIEDRNAIAAEMPWEDRDVAKTLYGMLSNTTAKFRISTKTHSNLDVLFGCRGHAVADTHVCVMCERAAPPDPAPRQRHDRNSHRKRLVVRVSRAERPCIQHDIRRGYYPKERV